MSYLAHSGIKGMRWGIRRYQNPDGTLTEEGKKRYARDVSRNHQRKRKDQVDDDALKDPQRWVEEDYSNKRNIANESRNLVNSLKDLERNTRSHKENPRMDLSKMTDKELRDSINREMLERQYNQMFNAPSTNKGREKVSQYLDVAGSALAVTASALGIALAIQQLKKG